MKATALSVTDLSFSYPGAGGKSQSLQVLSNLSMQVQEGEIVSILGASGCGKTTLLNLIAGLLQPASGTISVAASDSQKQNVIGYIFQQDALLPWRTVRANVLLASEISPASSKSDLEKRIPTLLQAFHLDASVLEHYPAELSGGMRQRVSIIQSLMFDPHLLLLDEPFSALDFYTKLRLESEFRHLVKQQNKAAVLVTHDIDEAIAMSDRVLVMEQGGRFINEHSIAMPADRSPEESRGTTQFAAHYQDIWSELRTSISQ